QKLSLCTQANQRLSMIHSSNNRFCTLILSTDLKRNDSLAACGQKNLVWEYFSKKLCLFEANLIIGDRQAETFKPCASQHGRVPIALGQLSQARGNIAAEIHNFEIRAFPMQLTRPSDTSRGDYCTFRQRSETTPMFGNQHVLDCGAR